MSDALSGKALGPAYRITQGWPPLFSSKLFGINSYDSGEATISVYSPSSTGYTPKPPILRSTQRRIHIRGRGARVLSVWGLCDVRSWAILGLCGHSLGHSLIGRQPPRLTLGMRSIAALAERLAPTTLVLGWCERFFLVRLGADFGGLLGALTDVVIQDALTDADVLGGDLD
jgi:hypothetical protein